MDSRCTDDATGTAWSGIRTPISTEFPRGIADGLVVLVPRKPRGVMRLGTWGLGSIPRTEFAKHLGSRADVRLSSTEFSTALDLCFYFQAV
ncbi:Phosphatidylserine decarboxylase proenzyme [Frankliniella fusca]|uniref:Phosphatidylserine decarboxylase proenzyme n=1 Tax=Frankliniella fusca TaxID=407009 RepID=A0AAE1HKM5_9NEOP|nr:Phosphatidylserine decarboxylase proenzyme [Frankliniella fusca]